MYTEHFGLNEKPFSISPDPRYLYLSQRHADALAHLVYGISESGGFIQLTGEVGTGKTTLIRSLLRQIPEKTEIALILNPRLSTKQFLQAICHELRIPVTARDTAKALIDRLNERLLALHAAARRAVLIVDEAQTMGPELLEQVRLLTNLETDRQKLLQIILIGQPELRELLARADMRQIAQRITGRYHLMPLNAADTAVYVNHRMKVAGGRPGIFSRRAIRRLYRLSRGIPRLINVIADRALLAAFARDQQRIGAGLVRRAAHEVFGRSPVIGRWPWAAAGIACVLLLLGGSRLDRAEPEALALAAADFTAPGPAGGGAGSGADPAGTVAAVDTATAADGNAGAAIAGTAALAAVVAAAGPERPLGALFALWGIELPASETEPCRLAETEGLRCLRLDGSSLSELRQLNRPVSLELIDTENGTAHQLLLRELDDRHATVAVAGKTHRVAIAELTRYRYGEHLLLWRPAIRDAGGALAEGDEGPGVIWLRTTLESLDANLPPGETPERFDAALTRAVADYQRRRGLVVDGIAGDRTLVALQADIGLVSVPLVAKRP